jgi:hypothetical protein
LGELLELVQAQRAIFISVEAIEEPLWIRRSRRAIRPWATTLGATTFRTAAAFGATVGGAGIGPASTATFRSATFTAPIAWRWSIGAALTLPSSIAGRTHVKTLAERPADRAGFVAINRAVSVRVKIIEQFLFHRRVATRRLVGRLFRRLGECRPGHQACADEGDPTQPNGHDSAS